MASTLALVALVLATDASLGAPKAPNRQFFAVEDFAAEPSQAEDAGPAIRAAIAAAIAHGPGAEVRFGKGVYRVGANPDGPAALMIGGGDRLALRGVPGETELVFTNPRQGGIYVGAAINTTLSGLVLDYDPPPFTQGTVVCVNQTQGHFDMDLHEGFPSLAEPWFAEAPKPYGQWGIIIEPDERRIKAGAADFLFLNRWEQVEAHRWRIHAAPDQWDRLMQMAPGDRFVHMARGGTGTVFFSGAVKPRIEDVTIHASASVAIGATGVDAMQVVRTRIAFRHGTQRLLTTNADGIHCQQNLRGPTVDGCLFEGMADDGINIYYYPNKVLEVLSNAAFRVTATGEIHAGDRLQFFDPGAGRILEEVEVQAVRRVNEGELLLELASPVSGVQASEDGGAHVHNLSRCGRGFAIRGNTFRDHRRHAMMIKAPDGVVEDNRIERCGAFAIVVGNDPDWPEGVVPRGITIRGNRIEQVGYSIWYPLMEHAAAIQVHGRAAGFRAAQDRIVRDIAIKNNIIVDPPGAGVSIVAAEGVRITGNRVDFANKAILRGEKAAVELYNVADVTIKALDVTTTRPEVIAAITADKDSKPRKLCIDLDTVVFAGGEPPADSPLR